VLRANRRFAQNGNVLRNPLIELSVILLAAVE
jgi:hypothetical protein